MSRNIELLKEVCAEEGFSFEEIHPCGSIIEVQYQDVAEIFSDFATPFNNQASCDLCLDKEYFYLFFKDYVKMPKTIGFLTPNCHEKHKHHLKHKTIKNIVTQVKKEFSFPVILKRNRGSLGDCVFKVKNSLIIPNRLEKIYKKDYVALFQEYVDVKEEYRAIFFYNELIFAYKKDIFGAKFVGNLSPLHYEGAKAQIVEDKALFSRLEKFGQQLAKRKVIPYIGLDIVIDSKDEMYLLEANSRPHFSHFLETTGSEILLKNLYRKMLRKLKDWR